MFDEIKVYQPVKITRAEGAEALPVGTIACGYEPWDPDKELLVTETKRDEDTWTGGYPSHCRSHEEIIGWFALVEITYKDILESYASWLEGGLQWVDGDMTPGERDLETAIRVIRDTLRLVPPKPDDAGEQE